MKDDDDRSEEAHGATQFTQCTQPLVKEVRTENRTVTLSATVAGLRKEGGCVPDQHTECTEGCDEDGGRKGIGGEVGNFTNSHYSNVRQLRVPLGSMEISYV
jgi:hypothetical protein